MSKLKETDIVFEAGKYWVLNDRTAYSVMQSTLTHSKIDSAYCFNADGLSLAIARCKYLAKVHP